MNYLVTEKERLKIQILGEKKGVDQWKIDLKVAELEKLKENYGILEDLNGDGYACPRKHEFLNKYFWSKL